MMETILSHRTNSVYHRSTDRTAGLHFLLSYALTHPHARGWIRPLTFLLQHDRLEREVRGA
jgi:hypothetical protein